MNAVTPFVFEDNLVRTVIRNDEPWFVGKDVCHVLSIQKHHQALERLDDDERGTCNVGTPQGAQDMIVVSEPGVFRLIFTSRKPEAERFKRWLAHEVLPALRKQGHYTVPGRELGSLPPDLDATPASATALKISLIREARLLFGARRASELWRDLGLPPVPWARPEGEEEGRHCLNHLLDASPAFGDRLGLLPMIEEALDDGADAGLNLIAHGIRVEPGTDGEGGFVVANRSRWLRDLYADTPFKGGRHVHCLRRLPGTRAAGPQRYDGGITSRGTFVPARYLDRSGDGRTYQ